MTFVLKFTLRSKGILHLIATLYKKKVNLRSKMTLHSKINLRLKFF